MPAYYRKAWSDQYFTGGVLYFLYVHIYYLDLHLQLTTDADIDVAHVGDFKSATAKFVCWFHKFVLSSLSDLATEYMKDTDFRQIFKEENLLLSFMFTW